MTWKRKTNTDYPKVTEREIDNLINAYRGGHINKELISLDQPVTKYGSDQQSTDMVLSDVIQSRDKDPIAEFIDMQPLRQGVDMLLSRLTEREGAVIRYRFGFIPLPGSASAIPQPWVKMDMAATSAQIAHAMSVTKQRVDQLEKRALERMRDWIMDFDKKEFYLGLLQG